MITREEFARGLGIVGEGGKVSERGVAELLRSPLARWGLSPRAAVLRHARDHLEAAGVRDQAPLLAAEVLDRLIHLGECEEVQVGHERYIAPATPRWIAIGHETGAVLSVGKLPDGLVEQSHGRVAHDCVRRIRVRTDDDLAALHLAGVRQTSFEDWLRPHGYLRHLARRRRCVVRSDEWSLSQFWEQLVSSVADDGLPLGEGAEVRLVTGEPGGFFGRQDREHCEGRWSVTGPDGVWCAYRRGYGDAHWHPGIVAVDGGKRRVLDLFDEDEWRWALLARGRCTGNHERIERLEDRIRLSFPAPRQLAAAMDLLGPRCASWSWAVDRGAPDPWRMLE